MKITIADIAEKAGVSKATVSRVLNNRPEGVGKETRERIQAIVRETGFQPSGVARGLATGKSRTVGLIIPDIANPFFPLLVRGVEVALSKAGYSLFLCNSACDILKEKDYVQLLMEKGVDGIILDSAESDCDCQLELLEKKGVPFVLLDRNIRGRDGSVGVFFDNHLGARLAAERFFARPECMLAFINGPADLSPFTLRLEGIREVMREKGVPEDRLKVLTGDFSLENGYQLISDLIAEARAGTGFRFNAVFTSNDMMAIGAVRALKDHGIAVPDEVEVIGFDDIEISRLVEPPLSTISQPGLEMGARSADLLLRMIEGKKPRPKTLVMKPGLVLRGTTRKLTEEER
jgi:LacI family transcriptional regulator